MTPTDDLFNIQDLKRWYRVDRIISPDAISLYLSSEHIFQISRELAARQIAEVITKDKAFYSNMLDPESGFHHIQCGAVIQTLEEYKSEIKKAYLAGMQRRISNAYG